ncbi:MAG: phosphoesterase PA-phosphatase related protein [Gemmatimonadetes bacterium]|nr:phosphoesterase PA-phosphatase related protein [Gemmatimonadota bacterium]
MKSPRAPRIDRRHALAGAAASGVAALVLLTTHADDEPGTLDLRVQRWMRDRHHVGTRRALTLASVAGTAPVYVGATVLAVARLATRRGPRRAVPVALAPLGAVLAHTVIKHLVSRERPAEAIAEGNHKPSFPSGHTTRATAVSLTIAYALLRERAAPRAFILPVAAGIPLVVGISRAYTHRHWTTDVLAGWSLGLVIAALSAAWMESMHDD